MNAKTRVLNLLEGKPIDRLPNFNIVMQLAAEDIGAPYSAFCRDAKVLAEGMIAAAETYSLDFVSAISDPMREGHDLGMAVEFPLNGVPYAPTPLLLVPEDMKKLRIVKPDDGARMSDRVRAVSLLHERVGGDMPVIGWVEGCFAQCADLRGVNEFLYDLYDEPEFVRELLDFVLEQELLFAKAQIAAGADIIGVGDAIASVAGPNFYESLALEYQIKLLSGIRDAGARTKLHICGNTTPFLEKLPWQHCDIIDCDWMVPLDRAAALFGDSVILSGNYDPVAVLMAGSVADVAGAVKGCAALAGSAKYASAAGCEVPKDAPRENFLQVARTLSEMAGQV